MVAPLVAWAAKKAIQKARTPEGRAAIRNVAERGAGAVQQARGQQTGTTWGTPEPHRALGRQWGDQSPAPSGGLWETAPSAPAPPPTAKRTFGRKPKQEAPAAPQSVSAAPSWSDPHGSTPPQGLWP